MTNFSYPVYLPSEPIGGWVKCFSKRLFVIPQIFILSFMSVWLFFRNPVMLLNSMFISWNIVMFLFRCFCFHYLHLGIYWYPLDFLEHIYNSSIEPKMSHISKSTFWRNIVSWFLFILCVFLWWGFGIWR